MSNNLDLLDDDLKALKQFCLRVEKKPYIRDGDRKNSFTSSAWQETPKAWLSFEEAKDAFEKGATVHFKGDYRPVDGIGFLVARSTEENRKPLGGDLDCCRNPLTGDITPWARAFLQKIRPFYTELSPSECGFRFFICGGHLPNGDNSTGYGPQDDTSTGDKEAIFAAKPKAREKYAKGEATFNGMEIYEAHRHLTITGARIDEFCYPKEDRSESITEALLPFTIVEEVKKVADATKQSSRGKLPKLRITDVIDTSGFTESGGQLFGSHPTEGSSTGQNLVVDKSADVFAYMHNKRGKGAPGGDAWVWLACECGAIRWEDAGKGVLRDGEVVRKTVEHAIRRGLITPEQAKYEVPPLTRGEALLLIADLKERAKTDAGAAFEPKYIDALAFLQKHDLAEYERTLAALKGKAAMRDLKKIVSKKLIDLTIKEAEAKKLEEKIVPKNIKEAAKEIIKDGQAYEYIYKVWQSRIKGNQWLGKGLLISRGVQSCLNSKGLHIYAHGKHGHGKSEGMEKMAELVPQEYMMDEDVSPLAVHYASEEGLLLPSTTLLIDEMIWTDSLGGMCKRITTHFQDGASHLTVIDGKPKRFKTKERISIWTNSADMQADEQLRDRFFDAPVDENQITDIIEFQKIRDTLPGTSEETERETAICQEILRDLALKTFTVKIPFSRRIIFPSKEGTRGYNIFSDLIKGLAAMRYAKREMDDKEQLLAVDEDFYDAKAIYEAVKGHSEERYGTAETKVLQAIMDNGYTALIKDIKRLTGLSEGRIKDIINGRGKDEQKRHGLLYKCPWLEADRVDISTVVGTDSRGYAVDRRTIHPNEYSLPETFKLSECGFELIGLKPDVPDADIDAPSTYHINNISSSIDVVDVSQEKREGILICEDESIPIENSISEEMNFKLSTYLISQNRGVGTSGCQPMAKNDKIGENEDVNDTSTSSTDIEKQVRRHEMGDNPSMGRIDMETPTSDITRIRIAARQEWGANGSVDHRIVAGKLKLPEEAVKAWFEANYKKLESGRYTQK